MTMLRSFAMAFLTFSRIPMPHVEWTPASMRYMMCFFPFVGMAIGALVGLWCWAAQALGLDTTLAALGVTVVPLLVTGGIHMDGFCDTVDAQASHADREKKRAILKDPHAGAFAIVAAVAYLLCYFSFAENLPFGRLGAGGIAVLFICLHAMSRSLSSVATITFPLASHDGMLAAEHVSSEQRPSLVFCIVLATVDAAVLVGVWGACGAILVVAALASLAALRMFADRQFGGMSGDLAGFFLQMAELAMLICFVIVSRVV